MVDSCSGVDRHYEAPCLPSLQWLESVRLVEIGEGKEGEKEKKIHLAVFDQRVRIPKAITAG